LKTGIQARPSFFSFPSELAHFFCPFFRRWVCDGRWLSVSVRSGWSMFLLVKAAWRLGGRHPTRVAPLPEQCCLQRGRDLLGRISFAPGWGLLRWGPMGARACGLSVRVISAAASCSSLICQRQHWRELYSVLGRRLHVSPLLLPAGMLRLCAWSFSAFLVGSLLG